MRRKEFEMKDRGKIEEVLRTAEIGYLAFNGVDGWPRVTPLNFLYDGRILWHGAVAGERFVCIRRDPRATFAVVTMAMYLPSHLVSEENATSASTAFKSVLVRGRCRMIEGAEEKCAILNQLMKKYQPEGRFKEITPRDPMYENTLKATGVYALVPEEFAGKFKFSQNKSKDDRQRMVKQLKERNSPLDLAIADEILKTLG